MKIVHYPHPTLRHRSKPVRRVDAELRTLIQEMFDLMYEANGIGLAANQVDLPFRLFVCNPVREDQESESELVFINPVLSNPKGSGEAEEGCLSLPELYAPVHRPETITLEAYDLEGKQFRQEIDGLFARVVQHETDHLDGVLFTDRLSEAATMQVQDTLAEFEGHYDRAHEEGRGKSDEEIAARLDELEKKYC